MISDQRVRDAARRSMESTANRMRGDLKRGLNVLATIGSTAPFVGLFGTVIGIVNSFQGFAFSHGLAMSAVGGGISDYLGEFQALRRNH